MIEIFQLPNGNFQWTLISETGQLQVVGTEHKTDFEAHRVAKIYRNRFKSESSFIDSYKDYIF